MPATAAPFRIVIAGGGAAGFFAAIAAARARPGAEVTLVEKSAHFLQKVRVSGGGRCNVTHACFDPRALSARYPRGGRALISPLHRFGPRETVEWFEARSVRLKTEPDGRMFPVSDSSQTIIDCLLREAEAAGVRLLTKCGIERAARAADGAGSFQLTLSDSGGALACDRLLLATGGCRAAAAGALAESLGHTLEPPVPSLFAFHVALPWLRALPGLSVEDVEIAAPGTGLARERGPLLVTHSGVSGPAVLRLSAWGARVFHGLDYRFPLHVHWLPDRTEQQIAAELAARRAAQPGKLVANSPPAPLPARLWEQLALAAGIAPATTWNRLPREQARALAALLARTELPVAGKSLNKEEFVTCGGVRLREVDFRTMQSRICAGLFFAGELLDIDGITGGFNFQAAWTTGWIAGHAMAGAASAIPSA